MRYIDSGSRAAEDALGTWLKDELNDQVAELRWQSGFFSVDGLAVFGETLRRLAAADSPVHALVGSNDGETLASHVAALVDLMGLPRAAAHLGIIYFAGGYFHPKTYHLRRIDGTQAAYVGSANLTASGVSSLHVEAGLILDTRAGDDPATLDMLAVAIDNWFIEARAGLEVVTSHEDVIRLTTEQVLSTALQPRPRAIAGEGAGDGPKRPRLRPLIAFPPVRYAAQGGVAQEPIAGQARPPTALPSAPRDPYPPYVFLAPGATAPTSGSDALSGATLPGESVGLIIRLNRDSSRHWRGGSGTANISVPVPAISTLRFGLFRARYERPRAEFSMLMRYVSDAIDLRAAPASTNVMVYGFAPEEVGHGDVRLLIPGSQAREILASTEARRLPAPADGDVALLEWPTLALPSFRLSLLQPRSAVFAAAAELYTNASNNAQMVGRGACWLPAGLSPNW